MSDIVKSVLYFGLVAIVTAIAYFGIKATTSREAEAKEDVWLTIDSNEADESGDLTLMPTRKYFLEIHIEEEPNFTDSDRVYLFEGDDFNIVIERVEPNDSKFYTTEELDEIYKDEPALGKLAKSLWGVDEPNEPECTHENGSDTICAVYHTDGSYCWVCSDCGKYVNSKESNENEWIRLPEPEPPMKYSLPIPTWPDFIELEKMLVIDQRCQKGDGTYEFSELRFGKGTKIYFKE